eukprot:gene712-7885_t
MTSANGTWQRIWLDFVSSGEEESEENLRNLLCSLHILCSASGTKHKERAFLAHEKQTLYKRYVARFDTNGMDVPPINTTHITRADILRSISTKTNCFGKVQPPSSDSQAKHWDWTFLNDVHRNCKDGTDSTDEGSLPLYRHQSDRFPSESPSRKLVSGDIQQQLPQRNLIDDLKKANTKLLQTVDRLSRNEAHLKQQLEILERESQKHNGSMSKRSKTDPGAFRGTASFSSKTSDLSCHEQHKNEQLHKNERATRTTGFLTASEQLHRDRMKQRGGKAPRTGLGRPASHSKSGVDVQTITVLV